MMMRVWAVWERNHIVTLLFIVLFLVSAPMKYPIHKGLFIVTNAFQSCISVTTFTLKKQFSFGFSGSHINRLIDKCFPSISFF